MAKSKYDFKVKKSLGQNFLKDEFVLDDIVDKSGVDSNTYVIEIGPGLGALTERLVKKAKHVIAVEYDKSLEKILRENIKAENFTLVMDDFLQVDLKQLVEKFEMGSEDISHKKIQVVANLPYYITQAIVMKVLESDVGISSMTVMMQKEVADRIFANEKSKEYGLLTIFINYLATKERLIEVSRESFSPVPNVDSSVVKMNLKYPFGMNTEMKKQEKVLSKVLHAAFSTRRKTLVNCLANNNLLSKKEAMEKLVGIGISVNARAEEISLEKYLELAKVVSDPLVTDSRDA